MMCDFAEKFVKDTQTILVNSKRYYLMLENIKKFLTILDNILTSLRLSLQLRIERAEISIWIILKNISNIWQIYRVFKKKHSNVCLFNIFKTNKRISKLFFLLKTEIHMKISNTEQTLYYFRGLRYLQNKTKFRKRQVHIHTDQKWSSQH